MSSSIKEQMFIIMKNARIGFDQGITTNDEKRIFDFHVSEMVDTDRTVMMYLRPSQIYGVIKLFKEKVPDVKYKMQVEIEPFQHNGEILDEGQVTIVFEWETPFPGTGRIAACFQ